METTGGRFRSLRVRRFLTRRLQTDASACSREESERASEKKDLLKRSNQQRRRKATGHRSFPHPRLSCSLGAARPLPAAAEGAGPAGQGRGLEGGVSPGNPRPGGGGLGQSCLLSPAAGGGWEA